MSQNPNDPIGMHSAEAARSRTTRMLVIAIVVATVTIAIILFTGPRLAHLMSPGADPKPEASIAATDRPDGPSADDATTRTAESTAPVPAGEESPDAATQTEEDAEPEFAEGDVRQAMCEEYAKRYLKARTGVDLVRSVQLSQAAGCGWNAVLHADAATHDFVPGALKVAQEMQAEDVETEGSSSTDSIDKIDRLSDKLSDLDRKVDELRYRVR